MANQDISMGDGIASSPVASPARARLAPIVRRHWAVLILAFVGGGVLGYGASHAITPTFQSSTLFIPPQQQSGAGAASALASLGALSGLLGGGGVKNSVDQYISMMQSNTISDRIIDRFQLIKVYDVQLRDDARKALGHHVQIAAGKKDGLIRVDVEDIDPKRAASMANQYVEELRILTSHLAVTEAQQRRVFFEKLLNDTKVKLANAQIALEATGFTAGALKAEPRSAAETYAKLRAELTGAQVKLQVLRNSLADTAPELQQQAAVVGALDDQVSKLGASQSSEAGSPDYIGKYRDFKYQETLFELFSKQYELARVDESREGSVIQVVDEGQPAERKFAPHRSIFALLGAVLVALAMTARLWRRAAPGASERVAP